MNQPSVRREAPPRPAPASAAGVDAATLAEIHQFYGRQSHLIDAGHAREWAETFTDGGVFDSPSYPGPVTGRDALTEFAARFHESGLTSGVVQRHVLTNLYVEHVDGNVATVHGYLQIVATPVGGDARVVRLTTITDLLDRGPGHWRIARRQVRREG
ncbi:nuclear transport factor 2 family protein [Rhodococcus sp. HNM0569]|uniref:nuclear transport factor 2 family protein n=1 Tax=Rhodococcus sp. HNM0569 TaxID=2716340 RepID=UPI00146D7054|nr:nuclear transport factor 2 family protein [Rhodococcus sp. HNM0569]NLU84583.1 nuclear transport factor 2 family protein [Rhodococcus sp. HNM0569]